MRVVFVTRRFWPQFGRSENTVANLAVGMKRLGAEPTVVAARWDPDWPSQVFYSDVPVVRLPRPWGQAWGTFRYLIALGKWLRRHRDQIDVVCVSQMRLDAYATLRALRRWPLPVVLRAERAGPAGDCQWQQRSRFGRRLQRRCRTADAVIAPDAAVAAELVASSYVRDQICSIPNGVPSRLIRHDNDRTAARSTMAEANSDLAVATDAKVVVFIGRLRQSSRLLQLVESWPSVLRRWPNARLWLIGDGPFRDTLEDRVVGLQIHGSVVMPGSFDDVADILSAANLFVCPANQPGLPLSLLEAAAVGVPIVACDTPEVRRCPALFGDNAVLVPPGDTEALSRTMVGILDKPPHDHAVMAARRSVQRDHACNRMVEQHLRLFERLVDGRQRQSALLQPP